MNAYIRFVLSYLNFSSLWDCCGTMRFSTDSWKNGERWQQMPFYVAARKNSPQITMLYTIRNANIFAAFSSNLFIRVTVQLISNFTTVTNTVKFLWEILPSLWILMWAELMPAFTSSQFIHSALSLLIPCIFLTIVFP